MDCETEIASILKLGLFYPQKVQNQKNQSSFLEIKTSAFTFALPKIRVKNAYNSTISKKRKRNYQG